MKKHILLFIAVLSLSACAPKVESKGLGLQVETEFQPFVTAFVNKAAQEGHPVSVENLTIKIDSTMTGPSGGPWILGICTTGGDSQPTITVNPYFWNNSGYGNADREELLFHEMGHCILGRGHTSETVGSVDGYPVQASIMNPYHLGAQRYGVNYTYYMQELFGVSTARTLYAYGVSQFINIYTLATGSSPAAPQIKTYKMSATVSGSIQHDEDLGDEGTPPSIEGMACGDAD